MVQTGGAGHDNKEVQKGSCGCNMLVKIVQIGDWNMDSDETKAVAHGLTLAKIKQVTAIIRNDADDKLYQICPHDGAGLSAQIDYTDATNVNIKRANGLDFDSADFDSTSYNRGYVVIYYTEDL